LDPVHFDWLAIARSVAIIGSPCNTGIFEQVPAVGIPGGIEASTPPEEAPPSGEPEEDALPLPEELAPLLLVDDPVEVPLELPAEVPDVEPTPDDVRPDPDDEEPDWVGPDPVPEVAPHAALHTMPVAAASPASQEALARMSLTARPPALRW
jgi:hypothetical protein